MPLHRKRPRRDETDESDEIMASEHATSNLRGVHDTHRRKRVSVNRASPNTQNTRQRSPSSTGSSNDDILEPDAPNSTVPSATQYEILRDGDFKELENPDLDDQRATQRHLARQRDPGQIGENRAADNAIVEEIRCVNFMCHMNMNVKLGPLINFVVGENGSGKSAVLTALTLCLGGKASATNRGGSLKSFVKTGEEAATLAVRLKNQGASAYQPDLYGSSIIIERHFSMSGSSGFKLKNSSGRLISNKKSDVDDVLEYFQLQVDNPMNVLTQDAAKSFITNSTPAMKYQFFYKGTQLEALDNDYQMVHELINSAETKISSMEHSITSLKARYDEAQKKADIVKDHAEMRYKMQSYRRQHAWAQVEEREAALRDIEGNFKAAQEESSQAEQNVESTSIAFDEYNARVEKASEQVSTLEQERVALDDEQTELQSKLKAAELEQNSCHLTQRNIITELKAANKKAQGCQDIVDKEVKRIADVDGGAHLQKTEDLEVAQRRVEEITKELKADIRKKSDLQNIYQRASEEVDVVNKALDTKKRVYEAANAELQELNRARPDPMAGFDKRMPQLLQRIRDDRGFRETPVGPIGSHIKLKKQKWSYILEKSFGAILNGFIVTSKADQLRLQAMMRGFGIENSPILIGKKNHIDTTNHEPDPRYDTTLRILDIDNDLVRSQLIINQGIEQSLLIEDLEEANRTMFMQDRPRNVKQCLTLSQQPDIGHRLSFAGLNNQNQTTDYVSADIRQKPRMSSDMEGRITYQRGVCERLRQDMELIKADRSRLLTKRKECEVALSRHDKLIESVEVKRQRAIDEVEKLEIELQDGNIEDGRLEALRGDLKEAQGGVALHENQYQEAIQAKDKAQITVIERAKDLDSFRVQLSDYEARMNKARKKLRSVNDARSVALTTKNSAIEALAECKDELGRLERKLDQFAELLAEFKEGASRISARVPVEDGMNAASLGASIKTMNEEIRQYNNRLGGTDEEINNAAANALESWQRAKSNQANLIRLNTYLKKSLFKRITQYKAFRRYISSNARMQFNYLLSERGFRGKMTIDHRGRQLDLTVEPDETKKSDKGRTTKTLSGGEKSFSSICLLLSVWEAMGAPMRCLDEFDVFMDDINRDVSTNLIIKGARRSVGRQFILISPKAISGGGAEKQADVRIHKLIHPREQQRRITEMMDV
ncbi:RecF/RecN/SMC N terminal domain-containing protein [Phlyctema vagabunda]|uniref:RecF/RecN/SMC N terminal domain-containing protein n=1 Tax=Phlyctema vagabunda TaxID=108571 RepID=A0ABR4PSP3_9HELO